ncbi:hypothetical protein [Mycobacteroides abscessus]|uniref:hypothetical protein n=1 Tax=Mycobacteroides abscessus TaxID=36809 RepID=UPI0009A7DE64|nr:hypothetical protein [Mycobacteroides abscessus]SKO16076.1 Uncharacterised protein [Mycobacteroides abscessus subsp. bolletii]SKX37087.1 Uncharacterised protein [Mycobacteroides abscessus subsp. bolletii]
MSDFVFAETPGIAAAGASTDALAGTTAGAAGMSVAAGAVAMPGLEEVSALNVARIASFAANLASALGMGSASQALYGTSVTGAGVAYELTDDLINTGFQAVV